MNKRQFFDQFHKQLSDKFKLSTRAIEKIRVHKLSKDKYIKWAKNKILRNQQELGIDLEAFKKRKAFLPRNSQAKKFNDKKTQGLLDCIQSLTSFIKTYSNDIKTAETIESEQWKELLVKTEFDLK